MKKHFLLFALMALLPLAAWADNPMVVTLRVPTVEYQGEAITPPIKSVTVGANTLTANDYTLSYQIKGDGDTYTNIAEIFDVGVYKVKVQGTGNYGNYSGEAILTVAKANLTVTAANVTKIYGDPDPAPNYSVTGYKGYDSEYSFPVSGLVLHRTNTSEDVGTYTYTIDNTNATVSGGNYNVNVTGSASLIINKREVTLSWSTAPLTYNRTYQAPTATVTNRAFEDVIAVTVTGQTINAGTGYTATASDLTGEKAANYKLPAANTHEFAIGQKTLTIIADAKSKTYGENDPALTYTATGLEAGDAITGALARAATEGDPVGNYAINQGSLTAGNNYLISYTSANLTINQREVTLTWSNDPLTYNKTAQAPTATAGNLVNNDVIDVTVTGQHTAAGENYEATASGLTGTKKDNYKLPTTGLTQTFSIGQKEVGLTWTNTELTYNKTPQKPTATATGVELADVVYVTVSGSYMSYSETPYTATAIELTGTDAGNYKLPAVTTQNFTIGQKALTITATAKSKTYGENDPALTYTATGLEAGDEITGALARAAGEDVNTYAINQGTLTAGDNYSITYNGANLTINQREVTLAWTNTALTYTGSAQKPTATAGNLVNNDVIGVTVTGEETAAGENYTAIASALTGEKAGNYKLPNDVEQSFSIGGAAVTITADNQTITYGDPIDLDAYTSSGLQAGHSVKSVTLTASTTNATTNGTITPSAVVIEDANHNDVTTNYTITPVNGTLIINQKAVTITANAQTVNYGTEISKLTSNVTSTGLLAGHSVKAVTLSTTNVNVTTNGTITPSEITIIDGGSNDVTPNYAVTYATGALIINPIALSLKAEDQAVNYPNAANTTVSNTTVTITSGSLKYNDQIGNIGLALVCDGTSIGTHPITINTDNASSNYTYTVTAGTLTISNTANELELADNDDAFQLIQDYAGQTLPVKIKFANRNEHRGYGSSNTETYPWLAEKWTTLVLPFDISVAELSQALDYAIVNVINPDATEIHGTSSIFWGKLTMKGGNGYHAGQADADTKLAANKPILLKIANDIDPNTYYNFGSRTIVAPTDLTMPAGGGATFVGTYANKTVDKDHGAETWWFMNGNESGWQFIGSSSTSSWTIVPFEAYIDMSGAPSYSAPNLTFYFEEFDGSTTAIKGVDADNRNKKLNAEGWYTLNGVKLQNAPTQKGIYIKDGKKIVIK